MRHKRRAVKVRPVKKRRGGGKAPGQGTRVRPREKKMGKESGKKRKKKEGKKRKNNRPD